LSFFSLVAAIPVLAPIIHFDGYSTFNDTFTYLAQSQWLQGHPYSEIAIGSGYYPYLSQIIVYQSNGSRMGATFFLGWVQSLYGIKWSYFVYPAVVSIPLIAGALATGGAVSLIVRRASRKFAFLSACAAANLFNGFMYGAAQGFFPQTFGLAFSIGALTLFAATISRDFSTGRLHPSNSERNSYLRLFRIAFPVSLLFAAFIFCYNDMMPFIVAALAVFLILSWIFNHGKTSFKNTLPLHVMLLLQTALFSNFEFIRVANNTLNVVRGVGSGAAQIGWPVPWSLLGFVAFPFGFIVPYGIGYWVVGQRLTPIIFLIFLTAFVYYIISAFKKKPSPYMLIHASVLVILSLGFLYFRYKVPAVSEVETGYSFLQFKIAKWSALFCTALMGGAIAFYRNRFSTKIPMYLLGILVVASIAVDAVIVPKNITQNFLDEMGFQHAPFSSFLNIEEMVKNIPPDDVIYLKFGADHHKLRQMVTYVLHERRFASDYTDDGYISGSLPVNEQAMPLSKAKWVMEYANPDEKNYISKLGNIGLIKAADYNNVLYLNVTKDGYGRETIGKDWWQWTTESVVFEYKRIKDSTDMKKARIKFSYLPTSPNQNLDIEVSGNKKTMLSLKMKEGTNTYVSELVDFTGNDISVRFTSKGKPQPISEKDPRPASFKIKNLELLSE
jgi:hypothetical protein